MAVAQSVRLTRIIRTKGGDALRTVGDARKYMLALPDGRATRVAWQRAAELILDGAGSDKITRQIEYALMLDGQITFGKTQTKRRPAR